MDRKGGTHLGVNRQRDRQMHVKTLLSFVLHMLVVNIQVPLTEEQKMQMKWARIPSCLYIRAHKSELDICNTYVQKDNHYTVGL